MSLLSFLHALPKTPRLNKKAEQKLKSQEATSILGYCQKKASLQDSPLPNIDAALEHDFKVTSRSLMGRCPQKAAWSKSGWMSTENAESFLSQNLHTNICDGICAQTVDVLQMLPEGSVVVERLTAQCEAVVNHLRDTTSGRVSVARMELYFKLDSNNR
eukprot:scaffold24157_cov18-Tisochrysis_lutea.AAC.1